jgi:hypothetical protein
MKPESVSKHIAFQPRGFRDVDLCRVCGEHVSAHERTNYGTRGENPMNDDAIPKQACACGWPRPLIAVTRDDGQLPTEPLSVRYDCPQCGTMHVAGEVPLSTVRHSRRARDLAR